MPFEQQPKPKTALDVLLLFIQGDIIMLHLKLCEFIWKLVARQIEQLCLIWIVSYFSTIVSLFVIFLILCQLISVLENSVKMIKKILFFIIFTFLLQVHLMKSSCFLILLSLVVSANWTYLVLNVPGTSLTLPKICHPMHKGWKCFHG